MGKKKKKNIVIQFLKNALRELKKERRNTVTQVRKNKKKYNRSANRKIINRELGE